MSAPITPTTEDLKRLWVTHCTNDAGRFGDHHKAAARSQSRIGFDLWLQQTKDEAADVGPAAFRIDVDPKDDDTVIVTDRRGRTRRIHREAADPEHRFMAYRLAAGWFANLPASPTIGTKGE